MMQIVSMIIIILCLITVAYQDIRYRAIHLLLPLFIFMVGLLMEIMAGNFNLEHMLLNLGFVALNLLVLVIYFSLKAKELVNPLKQYIGLGDILFFVALTPLFVPRSYVLFFIGGMIFSLVLNMVFRNKNAFNTIPLAGYLSIFLMIFMLTNVFTSSNLFYNPII